MTINIAKMRAETMALLDGTTPGPWNKVTQAGDWGLPGAHFIQPPDRPEPYAPQSAIAIIEFVTPYPAGASRKERDRARQADANARLIAAAPALAVNTLPLLDEIERLLDENNKLRDDMSGGSFYQEDDIDAMQNEIERLRAALKPFADVTAL